MAELTSWLGVHGVPTATSTTVGMGALTQYLKAHPVEHFMVVITALHVLGVLISIVCTKPAPTPPYCKRCRSHWCRKDTNGIKWCNY